MTSTVHLCFIIGLSLHVLIFLNDTYFQTYLRYSKGDNSSKGGFMEAEDELRRKEKHMNTIRTMTNCAFVMDIVLRLLLIGQASFLLAFLFTKAMKFCSQETSILRLEAQWALLLALTDLATLPLMLLWRLCLDSTPSTGFTKYRNLLRKREKNERMMKKLEEEEELEDLNYSAGDDDTDDDYKAEGGKIYLQTMNRKTEGDGNFVDSQILDNQNGKAPKERFFPDDTYENPFFGNSPHKSPAKKKKGTPLTMLKTEFKTVNELEKYAEKAKK